MAKISKAKKLLKCGFNIYGFGNFDLTIKEIDKVLFLVETNNFKELAIFYNHLSEQRL